MEQGYGEMAEGYNLKRRFRGSRSKEEEGGWGRDFGQAQILRIAVLQRGLTFISFFLLLSSVSKVMAVN
jgi:hypothetical protein